MSFRKLVRAARLAHEENPHGIVVGGVYQSNDRRDGYEPPPFVVEKIEAGYAYVWPEGKERPVYPKMASLRRIRLDRMKPGGKAGYTRVQPATKEEK